MLRQISDEHSALKRPRSQTPTIHMESERSPSLRERLQQEGWPEHLLTTIARQMQPPSNCGRRPTASDAESLLGHEITTLAVYDIVWTSPRADSIPGLAKGDIQEIIKIRRIDEIDDDKEDGGEQFLEEDENMDSMEEDEDLDIMAEDAPEQDGSHYIPEDLYPLETNFMFFFRMGEFEADGGCDPADEASPTYGPFKNFEGGELNKTMNNYIQRGCSEQESDIELFFKENLEDDCGNPFLGFRFWLQLKDRVHPMYGWSKLRAGVEGSPPATMSETEERRLSDDVPAPYKPWHYVEEGDREEEKEEEEEDEEDEEEEEEGSLVGKLQSLSPGQSC
ncbi:hypothetical protein DL98DRAFT_578344 [Cadophora sp. DSE1049]|nr:hypothetical protein DL98DRAFT_578344 [Cadophora sp. DSE1049]